MKSREDIRDFILSIEDKFPINDWKFNGIHLWPFLRLELFFYIRKELYHQKKAVTINNKVSTKALVSSVVLRLKGYARIINGYFEHIKFINSLSEKKYLFVANSVFRVTYNGQYFNRFFDVLINELNLSEKLFLLEGDYKNVNNLENSTTILNTDLELENYKLYKQAKNKLGKPSAIHYNFDGYNLLLDFLNTNDITIGFSKKFSKEKLINSLLPECNNKIEFYTKLLEKVKPKKALLLCYYGNLEFVAAANKLNVEVIEMQHGAISKAHMAYDSWTKVPNGGYDFLPKKYWCWNEPSKAIIDLWAKANEKYSAFVGGNVWVEYWKNINVDYPFRDFILYTLQPDSLTLQQLFHPQLINEIKTGKHQWFIRLHPRQFNKRKEIEEFLIGKEVYNLVNINEATEDPLPLLLKQCLIHVTNSSASTIEASVFEKKTILLNEIGRLYYSDLIKEGHAFFVEADEKFSNKIDEVIASVKLTAISNNNPTKFDYSKIFD